MAVSTKEQIIEAIEKLTVLELSELVTALEDKFNVKAVAPVAEEAFRDGAASKQRHRTAKEAELAACRGEDDLLAPLAQGLSGNQFLPGVGRRGQDNAEAAGEGLDLPERANAFPLVGGIRHTVRDVQKPPHRVPRSPQAFPG